VSATTLATLGLRGGNVQTSNTLWLNSNVSVNAGFTFIAGNVVANTTVLQVGANVQLNTSSVFLGNSTANAIMNTSAVIVGNAVVNSSAFSVSGSNIVLGANNVKFDQVIVRPITISTSGLSAQVIDAIAIATYRSSEYTLTIKDNDANNYQISKILLIHDGSAAYVTEYGILRSNSAMGVFSTGSNATHFTLTYTPVSSNTTIKGVAANALV
jgi:hypothetical protein